MTIENISLSISTKALDWAGIEHATPGSAVRLASVARHVTDCAKGPDKTSDQFAQTDQRLCYLPIEKYHI